tara:strand:+ start:6808 stop:8418 length:1611 start_codon:yes stop_codon:yes gene_type:complete
MATYSSGSAPQTQEASTLQVTSRQRTGEQARKPVLEKEKSIGYSATVSDQIFKISSLPSSSESVETAPKVVEVENCGKVPVTILVGYEEYDNDTTAGSLNYLHTIVNPGEIFSPPVRGILRASTNIQDGTPQTNATPNTDLYVDSGADTDDVTATNNVDNSDTNTLVYLEPYTDAANCTANLFYVGDLIRIRDEVMEVTDIGDKSDLANNTLTVIRGAYGSSATTSTDDDDPVRLPFFNMFHKFNDTSVNGSGDGKSSASTIVKTNGDGKFKAMNFFGFGRAATGLRGIVPGSVNIKFFTEGGYVYAGLAGLNANTESGLSAGTDYAFNITIDEGATQTNVQFTVDATNTKFGGTNGVISKMQAALDAQTANVSSNMKDKQVTVAIVDGDLRITSESNMEHTGVVIANPSSGTTCWGVGRLPAATAWVTQAAKTPDDTVFDRVTHSSEPNDSQFVYDDGYGNLIGNARGTISYETGAFELRNAPRNAEMRFSVLHSTALSGKVDNATDGDRANTLTTILANTPNQKVNGKVKVRTF